MFAKVLILAFLIGWSGTALIGHCVWDGGAVAAAADAHAGHMDHAGQTMDVPWGDVLLYVVRFGYSVSLLLLLGWALWSAIRPLNRDLLKLWPKVGFRLQLIHLIGFVVYAALHWPDLADGVGSGSFLDILRNTSDGRSWLFTGLLSIAGLPLLFHGNRVVDGAWAILMIAARSLQGDVDGVGADLLARVGDALHLAAAAFWTGGALALLVLFIKFPETFRPFASIFTKVSVASFIVLVATGVFTTWLFTEQLSDLVRTPWGWLLLVKTVLALLLLPMLFWRKSSSTTRSSSAFRIPRAGFVLLIVLVGISGVLSHISPAVERIHFHWHVMGNEAHITAEIEDVRAGSNRLLLKIWVPEEEERPEVEAVVSAPGQPEETALLVPSDLPSEPWESFAGFEKFTFEGDVAISDPEQAVLYITLRKSNGETLEYNKALLEP